MPSQKKAPLLEGKASHNKMCESEALSALLESCCSQKVHDLALPTLHLRSCVWEMIEYGNSEDAVRHMSAS